jgi:Mu-like prophage tail protein gpP
MSDEVTVFVNGAEYSGWKDATALASIDSVCGEFAVGVFDKWGQMQIPKEIKPGDRCQVLLGDVPVNTGYVDEVSPAISATSHGITIKGRDKTADMVDCSAVLDSYEYRGIQLDAFAQMLCGPFGIPLKVETDMGAPFERIAINPGDTTYSCLEFVARQRGVLLTTDGEGALVLSARGKFEAAGDALVEGANIKAGTATFSFRDRFSDYLVHGQKPAFLDGAEDPKENEIGKARDPNVMRHRPLLLTAEFWTTAESALIRAENICANRAGHSTRVNIRVVGWRQSSGELWRPGLRLPIVSPNLYLDGAEMVISTVRYTFSDSGGTECELEMTRPDAYLDNCSGQVEKDAIEW